MVKKYTAQSLPPSERPAEFEVLRTANLFTLFVILAKSASAFQLQPADLHFMDDIQRSSFRFFQEQTHPETGMVADRARADGVNRPELSSIAATGFGLTSLCIAAERGWVSKTSAQADTLKALRFIRYRMPHVRGFYYHFVHNATGERAGRNEVSSIDTALMLAGVLTARQYFEHSEIRDLADAIYQRVDWPWMLNGQKTLSMGWKPETGFIRHHWAHYNESMLLYLMAMGSPTHPIPVDSWKAWERTEVRMYGGTTFIHCAPLFTHQFSHAWIDFRRKRDDVADYFRNSKLATLAQRQFCADQNSRFSEWSDELWGLTAADTPKGYKVIGTALDEHDMRRLDGTLVPCAPGGSLPFAPQECLAALRKMKSVYGDRIYKLYGFVDAFNPQTGWFAPDVIGIDVGITLVMAENLRSEFVWKTFMKNVEVQSAMKSAGFRDLTPYEAASLDRDRTSLFKLKLESAPVTEQALNAPAPETAPKN